MVLRRSPSSEYRTEREAVTTIVEMLEKAGYVPFVPGKQYPAGAKVYLNNRGKARRW